VSVTARSHLRGHPIVCIDGDYYYEDTGEPTAPNWKGRPCGYCGEHETKEGHDACLGALPGVKNACCGHGDRDMSYISFENGVTVRGFVVDTGEERE